MKIDPNTYHLGLQSFFNDSMIEQLRQMATLYTNGVDGAVAAVENAKVSEVTGSIVASEKLAQLTDAALDFIHRIDIAIDDYEALLSKVDFKIRQEYNSARYILDATVSSTPWKFKGGAHYTDA